MAPIITVLNLLICWLYYTVPCNAQLAFEKPGPGIKSGPVLGIPVDISPHQKKVVDFEREAVNSLLGRLRGTAAEGFVMEYGDKVQLLQDWSPLDGGLDGVSQRVELDTDIRKYEQTLLYNALYAGMVKLESNNDSSLKVLIIIGEGNNAGSTVRYSQLKKLARSANIQCFALLVADHNVMGGRVRHFGFYLYDLAGATKGAGYDIEASRKHLDKAIGNLLGRIR